MLNLLKTDLQPEASQTARHEVIQLGTNGGRVGAIVEDLHEQAMLYAVVH